MTARTMLGVLIMLLLLGATAIFIASRIVRGPETKRNLGLGAAVIFFFAVCGLAGYFLIPAFGIGGWGCTG